MLPHLFSLPVSVDADAADVGDVQGLCAGSAPQCASQVAHAAGENIAVAIVLSGGCHADQQALQIGKEGKVRIGVSDVELAHVIHQSPQFAHVLY
ncbi:MAG: Uncharacterised protein [Synechococcus sp. MIT S9220]|nr:MAG: Uncharacterised protein [Synechococcus sp. MIT S9220]